MPLQPFPWGQLPDLQLATTASFSRDGDRVLFVLRTTRTGEGSAQRVAEHDFTTGQMRDVGPVLAITGGGAPQNVAFSRANPDLPVPDGLSPAELARFEALRTGALVAFDTAAQLLPGDTDTRHDVYLLDTGSGALTLVDTPLIDTRNTIRLSDLSDDGRTLAIYEGETRRLVLIDTVTEAAEDVSALLRAIGLDPAVSANLIEEVVLSGDGSRVLVVLRNGRPILYDRTADTVTDLTEATTGVFVLGGLPVGGLQYAVLSADGSKLFYHASTAFGSTEFVTVPGGLYRYDLDTGERLALGVRDVFFRTISASDDGRYVAFRSGDTGLVAPELSDGRSDAYVQDVLTGQRYLLGAELEGGKPEVIPWGPVISGDGQRAVVFATDSRLYDPSVPEARGDAYFVEGASRWLPGDRALEARILVQVAEGVGLEGVELLLSDAAVDLRLTTGPDGAVLFDLPDSFAGTITALRSYGAGDPAITTADALEALRLAVGLGLSRGAPTGRDFVAADFDGDGAVTTADALAILRAAVGLPSEFAPRWIIAESAAVAAVASHESIPEFGALPLAGILAGEPLDLTAVLVGRITEFG